jgi:Ca2+-binding RTX toxin-like protein
VANGTIVLGANCGVNDTGVHCQGKSFVVNGNGGDDHITVSGGVRSTQYGGDGNDWMVGGNLADVFNGGNGFDTVDYSQRTTTIVGTPGTGADDGASRERDNIMGDVEQVILP